MFVRGLERWAGCSSLRNLQIAEGEFKYLSSDTSCPLCGVACVASDIDL